MGNKCSTCKHWDDSHNETASWSAVLYSHHGICNYAKILDDFESYRDDDDTLPSMADNAPAVVFSGCDDDRVFTHMLHFCAQWSARP